MDKPLTVQSDRTMLLDVHSPSYEECRSDIMAFSELIKSPEHIHTYQITPLSVWNSVSAGIGESQIIFRLEKWSKYGIDKRVISFINDMASRLGSFILTECDDDNLTLKVMRDGAAREISSDKTLSKLLERVSLNTFKLSKKNRGTLKSSMISLSYPVDDRIPLKKGKYLKIHSSGFEPREYQRQAANSFLGNGDPGSGYGTIVMPCGSGKTIVGILIMEALSTNTLILCPNVIAVRQWIRELIDKTNLGPDDIGEYSGEKKEIRSVTVTTYQMVTHGSGSEEYLTDRLKKLIAEDWGLVIYDEVHMLPAPVFRFTAEMQSMHRLGLTATLIREDGRETEVFSLVGPKRYDVPWSDLSETGYIATARCHEIRIPMTEDDRISYAIGSKRDKFRIASENQRKMKIAKQLVEKHSGERILIIGQFLSQLEMLSEELKAPLITGKTPNSVREELYDSFRNGDIGLLVVSKVANAALDLPDASVAIQVSGTFGSRQEEAQRLGRLMRPKNRDSHFYTLVSENTIEEEYALNREKFLCEQGYGYSTERIETE